MCGATLTRVVQFGVSKPLRSTKSGFGVNVKIQDEIFEIGEKIIGSPILTVNNKFLKLTKK